MNNRYISCIIFAILLFCTSFEAAAQQPTKLPFFEGFEVDTRNSEWNLEVGPRAKKLTNKWFVSEYEPYMGDSCLIISNNNGSTPAYTADKPGMSVAYIDLVLPSGTDYDISFAWRCMGQELNDGFYVYLQPQSSKRIESSLSSTVSAEVSGNALQFGAAKQRRLYGGKRWAIAETTFAVPPMGGKPVAYRLYFIWHNDAAGASDMAVCIDNIQIAAKSDANPRPTDVDCSYDGESANLSWKGAADASYQVVYRRYGEKSVSDTIDVVKNATSTPIPDMSEGVYDFFVRTTSASGDTSVWTVLSNKLIYTVQCIDYLNLKAENCTFSDKGDGSVHADPYKNTGVLDFGFDNWEDSRHTVHYLPDETDPYTTVGGGLKTVGPHSVASVRIGNNQGAGAESVSYPYTLYPKDSTILLIDYAIVYESPNHPNEEEQPFVKIEILDENGNLINDDGLRCNEVYFYPPVKGDNSQDNVWILEDGDKFVDKDGNKEDDILWRDWSTMGINLLSISENLTLPKDIKIRVTVSDCAFEKHFSHAFFSIRCGKAIVDAYSCGEAETLKASAPPGFEYRWYNHKTPGTTITTNREFEIPVADADTFMCDVIFAGKGQCYFTMPVYLVPRVAKADFVPEHRPHDCRNLLVLRNTGGVMSDGVLTGKPCDKIKWTVTDLSTGKDTVMTSVSPELYFPPEGDTISIRLYTDLGTPECFDEKEWQEYIVPSIVGGRDTTVVRHVCQFPYTFNGEPYTEPGDYKIPYTNYAGCQSELTLKLSYLEPVHEPPVFDTICMGDTCYLFEGRKFFTSGDYIRTIPSSMGCDSLITTLHLYVIDSVSVEFGSTYDACADSAYFDMPYSLLSGEPVAYSLRFGAKASGAGFADVDSVEITDGYLRIALPEKVVRPDVYATDVVFHTDSCGAYTVPLSFTVNYPVKDIMVQKWNDVIALLNSEHNYGGFEYSQYQWYRNGEAISGATGSYLYIGSQGGQFSETDEYRVRLTRSGEQLAIMSCPLKPEKRAAEGYITLVAVQSTRTVSVSPSPTEQGVARWYTPSGLLVSQQVVAPFATSIPMPATAGIYILQLELPAETVKCKVVVY